MQLITGISSMCFIVSVFNSIKTKIIYLKSSFIKN